MLSAREALIFTALADAVTAPHSPLPPVAQTDALPAVERWLALTPRPNRLALRLSLHVLDLAPRALGRRRRLSSLGRSERGEALESLERIPLLGRVAQALCAMASVCYFGDLGVSRALGYDAEERVARGRAPRRAELRT